MKNKNLLILSVATILLILNSCSSTKIVVTDEMKTQWNTNYTYVFVHGLSGWGHYDFMNNFFPYWGMKNGSLMKQLRKQGFECYDASVDPQGSAWDRACELYAQLTGTVTDYGAEHSARCGHERFGRDFSKKPLIPEWDENHKINLLGHSFGGVTVRLLAHLMAEGSKAERITTPEEDLSPLFKGGHADWIYSITALAAPHNGTSAYHVPDQSTEPKTFMHKMMEKTNTPKKDGRADYDYASFDMHIQNAAEINRWLLTLDSVYYFSFPCCATQEAEDGTQEPIQGLMEKHFQRISRNIGIYEDTTSDGITLGKEWQRNDGLVNTISARAPDYAPSEVFTETVAASANLSTANSSAPPLKKGVWYIMPEFTGDHMSLQGGLTIKTDITEFYINHLDMINKL
ncbi:MAG: hypothetical protein J5647_00760 [Spirochaetaceae bacterium]|nr:hypothetical protein [Spirochaetaceae bacterium]